MAECKGGGGGPGDLIQGWRYHRDAIIKSWFAGGREGSWKPSAYVRLGSKDAK